MIPFELIKYQVSKFTALIVNIYNCDQFYPLVSGDSTLLIFMVLDIFKDFLTSWEV